MLVEGGRRDARHSHVEQSPPALAAARRSTHSPGAYTRDSHSAGASSSDACSCNARSVLRRAPHAAPRCVCCSGLCLGQCC
ncbi:unnamed protein product, partial [Brenthis ino]